MKAPSTTLVSDSKGSCDSWPFALLGMRNAHTMPMGLTGRPAAAGGPHAGRDFQHAVQNEAWSPQSAARTWVLIGPGE